MSDDDRFGYDSAELTITTDDGDETIPITDVDVELTDREREHLSMVGAIDPDDFEHGFIGTMPVGDTLTDAVEDLARDERQRIERALKGAVLAGYDGVDVHRQPFLTEPMSSSDRYKPTFEVDIEPWHAPAPDAANGKRTERYTWRWFDNDRLRELIADGRLAEVLGGE